MLHRIRDSKALLTMLAVQRKLTDCVEELDSTGCKDDAAALQVVLNSVDMQVLLLKPIVLVELDA